MKFVTLLSLLFSILMTSCGIFHSNPLISNRDSPPQMNNGSTDSSNSDRTRPPNANSEATNVGVTTDPQETKDLELAHARFAKLSGFEIWKLRYCVEKIWRYSPQSDVCELGSFTIVKKVMNPGFTSYNLKCLFKKDSDVQISLSNVGRDGYDEVYFDVSNYTLTTTFKSPDHKPISAATIDISDQVKPTMTPFRGIRAKSFAQAFNLSVQTVYIMEEIPHPMCQYDAVSQQGSQISIKGFCGKRAHEVSHNIDGIVGLLRASASIEVLTATKQLKNLDGLPFELVTLLRQIHSGETDPFKEVRAAGFAYARQYFKDYQLDFEDTRDADIQNLRRMMEVGYIFSKLASTGILPKPFDLIKVGSRFDRIYLTWTPTLEWSWFKAIVNLVPWEYRGTLDHTDLVSGGDFLALFDSFKYSDLLIDGYSSLGLLDSEHLSFINTRREALKKVASTPLMTKERYAEYLSTLPLWSKTTNTIREWIVSTGYRYYQNEGYLKVEMLNGNRAPLFISKDHENCFCGFYLRNTDIFDGRSLPAELFGEFQFKIPEGANNYDMEFLLQEIVRLGLATSDEANAKRFWPKPT